MKTMIRVGNSLPYHVYHFLQNCDSAQEMMENLTVAYEGTVEVQDPTINNLNRRYDHLFVQQGESLTQTFDRFNCLVKSWEH